MAMELTWLGHACFRIESEGETMYIDPFIEGNPTSPIEVSDADDADWVLVTHGHDDHYGNAVEVAKNTGATLVSNFEITVDAEEKGVDATEPMNIGGSVDVGTPTVHMTEAQHSSGGLGHQAGFVIEWNDNTIYHAGDTGLFSDMKLINEFLDPDVGLIPIGDRFTMGPESASKAVEFLGLRQAIPMHYNTMEGIKQDPGDFVDAVGNTADVVVLEPGESHQLADVAV
jgi:L-ascorbate metabolism protein UlaG (beta-lactamase superfamily)